MTDIYWDNALMLQNVGAEDSTEFIIEINMLSLMRIKLKYICRIFIVRTFLIYHTVKQHFFQLTEQK